jgi:hypothetical protein
MGSSYDVRVKHSIFFLYVGHLQQKRKTLSDEKTKPHLPLILSSKDIFNPTNSIYFLLVCRNENNIFSFLPNL